MVFQGGCIAIRTLTSVVSYRKQKLFIIILPKIDGIFQFCLHQDSIIKMESRCYFNSTFQVQYFNVIISQLIPNIDCDHILKNLDLDDNNFASNYQKVMILQELYIFFEYMYIGDKKKIITDFF